MARKLARPGQPAKAAVPAAADVEFELLLTAMAPTGEAIGRHEGMVVFAPYGVPGERVRVRLVVRKRNFARGEIVAVLETALARATPVCSYFGRCGGCDWQHIDYATQVAYKTGIVREQLARIGKFAELDVRDCVASPQPYQYRNHARLAVTPEGRPGYRAAGGHALVEVDACPILEPALQADLQSLAQGTAEVPGLQMGDEIELRTWEEGIRVAGFDYQASPGAFFQANTAVAEQLVAEVMAAAALTGRERVLDLYCGVGLFTVPLGRAAATVAGVEENALAAADARANLAVAGIVGVILAEDVTAALAAPAVGTAPWDIVVLDPPRTGVEPQALQLLAGLAAPKIIYVSCEPATLARDARILCDRGYTLAYVQPFDLFPQTRHVECVAVFEL